MENIHEIKLMSVLCVTVVILSFLLYDTAIKNLDISAEGNSRTIK